MIKFEEDPSSPPPITSLLNRRWLLIGAAIILFLVGGFLLVQCNVSGKTRSDRTPHMTAASPSAASIIQTVKNTATVPAAPTENKVSIQIKTTDVPTPSASDGMGWLAVSLAEGANIHLFASPIGGQSFTRLTKGAWDDIHPAVSPDGKRIAYSSRQNGYWDLFALDLSTGVATRLTDSGDYDGAPTWSPDAQWLAFETYTQNGSQIAVLSLSDPSQAPILLTADTNLNHSPAWSPKGRQIAYVSDQTQVSSLNIADLDKTDGRITTVTTSHTGGLAHPAWSPDGSQLAYARVEGGLSTIYVIDLSQPQAPEKKIGSGDWPVWSPKGNLIATRVSMPNQQYLCAYQVSDGSLAMPLQALPGGLNGLTWVPGNLPSPLPAALQNAAEQTPAPLWTSQPAEQAAPVAGRSSVVQIADLDAPQPSLDSQAAGAFTAMRLELANQIGWDFLASLENAFVPITSPLSPGMGSDWLYTGRGIAVNTLPIRAGWMAVVREDIGSQTYWRIYLKTRYQDGSQGIPLVDTPWDLNARYGGNPQVYEQGGAPSATIPTGYWFDFTAFAMRYGWERQPALLNWRTYYQGTRVNEFAFTSGLDWNAAMLELYPPEALVSPTSVHSVQPSATTVPTWYKTRTPTTAPTATITPTRRPTWTPGP